MARTCISRFRLLWSVCLPGGYKHAVLALLHRRLQEGRHLTHHTICTNKHHSVPCVPFLASYVLAEAVQGHCWVITTSCFHIGWLVSLVVLSATIQWHASATPIHVSCYIRCPLAMPWAEWQGIDCNMLEADCISVKLIWADPSESSIQHHRA